MLMDEEFAVEVVDWGHTLLHAKRAVQVILTSAPDVAEWNFLQNEISITNLQTKKKYIPNI